MSDINVTPFIDVMLVLLIIFMVAAPLSTVDVSVELAGVQRGSATAPDKPIFLTLKSDLSLTLAEDVIESDALQSVLDRDTAGDRDRRIYLRADRAVAYGELMKVMNLLRAAGYLKVALVGLEDASKPFSRVARRPHDFAHARWGPRSRWRRAHAALARRGGAHGACARRRGVDCYWLASRRSRAERAAARRHDRSFPGHAEFDSPGAECG